jgi:hypothetical protein
MTRTVKLEPNWKQLFTVFQRELSNQISRLTDGRNKELLREVQSILVPIAICANSATDMEEIDTLRTMLTDALSAVDQAANRLEYSEEERPETGGNQAVVDAFEEASIDARMAQAYGEEEGVNNYVILSNVDHYVVLSLDGVVEGVPVYEHLHVFSDLDAAREYVRRLEGKA